MPTDQPKRRRKLIKPSLQLRMTGIFLGISLLCFLLQLALVGLALADVANELPSGNAALAASIPSTLGRVLLVSLVVFLPLMVLVGVSVTFRIAGPVYRFEQYLRGVTEGTETGPCRIRKGDELQDLCELITVATEPIRARNLEQRDSAGPAAEDPGRRVA